MDQGLPDEGEVDDVHMCSVYIVYIDCTTSTATNS